MKPASTLTTLFGHNLWANLRLLDVCATLSSAQLETAVPGTYGSIRETLQHIVTAEQSYYFRVSTGKPLHRPVNAAPLTITEMAASIQTTGTGLIAWAAKVQADDTVEIDWNGTPRDVPKTIILTQVINHATEHRAQVMTMLTQLGVQPPELSGWEYFDASG